MDHEGNIAKFNQAAEEAFRAAYEATLYNIKHGIEKRMSAPADGCYSNACAGPTSRGTMAHYYENRRNIRIEVLLVDFLDGATSDAMPMFDAAGRWAALSGLRKNDVRMSRIYAGSNGEVGSVERDEDRAIWLVEFTR